LPTPFAQTLAGINPTLFDTSGTNPPPHLAASATVGLQPGVATGGQPAFTADLDLPFRQDSFGLSTPQFGTPQPVSNFGFAILSDIEAFFVIQASQGDQRTSVLQAPKVTLFNGQFASVIDSSFRPFVISVIPVVGEFAAAQQPVIVVLSEGTMMSVQAVVSDDRRYVRMTLLPFFSSVGDVQTFTFEGTETTSTSTDSTDSDNANGKDKNAKDSKTTTRSGTTVQLPTFNVISVSTTVSVPDGGTVLLGGIKRLSEGRNEFGVPLLSKVPYIDRLFRNVGIGRETDSLMMMVTPHIIIQEEEEDRLGTANQ
jgi:general secretion pathway protein D